MIDEKTLTVLEYPKVLEHLAGYCAFPVSQEKALLLRPLSDPFLVHHRQALTSEAQHLVSRIPDLTIGGVRDVRQQVDLARHGGVLAPNDLLDVKSTLVAARTLGRSFDRFEIQFPLLTDLVRQMPFAPGLIDAISRALSDRGEILDSASDRLNQTRRDLRIVHDRLLSRLQKMVMDPKNAPYLQETIVTQRDGRYVLPLRAEFKGRIRSIIHDQSSSGATLFVEPFGVVDMNNEYRELQLIERDEERRILTDLSLLVGGLAEELGQVIDVLAEFDLILACARYSDDLQANEPKLLSLHPQRRVEAISNENINPKENQEREPRSTKPTIRLYQARHPLLPKEHVVAIDVELDANTLAMVITGPNTGGKTVALKTVGLLALMAQSGLHIPTASGSEISIFDSIFADIGDEQSIEQSLSTFSGHVTNIVRILQKADDKSLVILDELGAGTDPQEGAALARAILTRLVERRAMTLVTTHHPELKAYAHATLGVVNASVEFDLETLRPTFHLSIGLPGRSNALAIAERLGMPEDVIAEARTEIDPNELRADDLLDEIHHQREVARRNREEAERSRQEAEALRQELYMRLESIEDERFRILEETRQETELHLKELTEEIAEIRRQMGRAHQPLEMIAEAEEKLAQIEQSIDEPVERQAPLLGPELRKHERKKLRAIGLGDRVRIRSLGAQGLVTSMGEDEVEVQVGVLRVRTRLNDLELPSPSGAIAQPAEKPRKAAPGGEKKNRLELPESPGIELDLRGQRADEAGDALERYLDAAFLAGLPFVRIIHGKGTGKLRDMVRRALKDSGHVRSFEAGGEKEGGEGVTVAKLAVGE